MMVIMILIYEDSKKIDCDDGDDNDDDDDDYDVIENDSSLHHNISNTFFQPITSYLNQPTLTCMILIYIQ
jgi:hypothetical protein